MVILGLHCSSLSLIAQHASTKNDDKTSFATTDRSTKIAKAKVPLPVE
jgi:hypothetical protein